MLTLRLKLAQLHLYAHDTWLSTFIAARRTSTHTAAGSTATRRTFTINARQGGSLQAQPRHGVLTSEKSHASSQGTQKRLKAKDSPYQSDLKILSTREELGKALQAYDLKAVIAQYTGLPNHKPLTTREVSALAQCVHQCLRQELFKQTTPTKRDDIDNIVSFAKQLVRDVQQERLLPSALAHVHLLGIFKESGARATGIEFWQWLESQDGDHVNLDVYAVAIDLLSINGSSLDELEELYENALARFPGTFSAYHLSPGAILPDREQELNIRGLPMSLLQSIAYARLLRGESRKAYLALDSAFRLFPTSVPPRFLSIFQDERPVSEAYTVFAIACRAGVQIPSGQFKSLLAKLGECSNLESVTAHIVKLRLMVAALYLQLGSSGALTSNSVSELVITLTQLCRVPAVVGLDREQRSEVIDEILKTIRQIMAVCVRYNAMPTTTAFNSIITNIAGYGGVEEVLGIATADMKALRLEPNEVTRRSMMTAAGLLKNASLVEKFWSDIVHTRMEQQSVPTGLDIQVFVRAARLVDDEEVIRVARTALDTYKDHIHPKHVASIEHQFELPLESPEGSQHIESGSAQEVLEGIAAIQRDLAYIDDHTEHLPAVQDFSSQELPISLLPMNPWGVSEEVMHRLYDDYTTESFPKGATRLGDIPSGAPSTRQAGEIPDLSHCQESCKAPKPAAETAVTSPKLSVTNIAFGRLRYENWKALNFLLNLAAANDRQYERIVDQAIAARTRPASRDLGLSADQIEAMKGFGLSSGRAVAEGGKATSESDVARIEIARLRGMLP